MAITENTVLNTGENTLAKYEDFKLPSMIEGEFSTEELSDDLAGVQITFPRVKIPSGGSLQFELPGGNPEDPEYAKTIDGVILFGHLANAYWADGGLDEDENGPPNCASVDGITGAGTPGGSCAICPMNAWGSVANGKGKACKNTRHIYLLRDGDFIPISISLPPTSLRPYNDFVSSCFAARQRGTCGSIVQLGLKRMNNGKDDYSVATFKKLYDFSGPQLTAIRQYAGAVKQQVKFMLNQQAAEVESRIAIPEYSDGAIVDTAFTDVAGRLAKASVSADDLPM
jgi:hypothetical protein